MLKPCEIIGVITEWKLVHSIVSILIGNIKISNYMFVLIVGIAIFIIYLKWNAGYFKRRGIKCLPGMVPFFGHMATVLGRKEHLKDLHDRLYKAFPDEKYVGEMLMNRPTIMIKDLELVKQIYVTKFDHFVNHAAMIDPDVDSILSNVLIFLQDDKWRDMRSTLTPAFSIAKTKNMFNFVDQTSRQVVTTFMKKLNERTGDDPLDVEIHDAFGRYVNDVIATSAFGLVIDSLSTPNNRFYEMGRRSTNINFIQNLKFLLYASYPRVMKFFKISAFDEQVKNFFRSLVMGTIKFREKENIYRPDMMHFLAEARRGPSKCDYNPSDDIEQFYHSLKKSQKQRIWTDDEIVAQAMIFFIAGFDNSSNLLSFIAYELALNEPVQKRLQQEVDKLVANKGKQICYDDLSELKYMEAVLYETLRLRPAFTSNDRMCTKTFKLPPTSENDGYTLQPGDMVQIPIYSIHRDERYFSNPTSFCPERFLDEGDEGDSWNRLAFIPFGAGPRKCIGQKFAMMAIKCLLFHFIAEIEFVQIQKTKLPTLMNIHKICIDHEKGLWVGLNPRKKSQ